MQGGKSLAMKCMYLETDKRRKCCGCTACEKVCPTHAIKMSPDNEGFLYPHVDNQICVECGLCNQVCPFGQHKDNKEKIPLGVYGFKHKSNEVRILSSSGGAFTAIANMVLEKKGVVYGCAFNDKYEAVHIRITTCQALERIRKSKYVQSRLDDIFLQVQADLEEEKYVLFTGTACQVAGLSKYIEQKKISNKTLLCCDIICHGVPSPLIWKEYIEYQRAQLGGMIQSVCFREKNSHGGWTPLVMQIRTTEKVYKKQSDSDPFYRLFFDHYILRPCCHECPFTNFSRPSDITIADFWGIEKANSGFADSLGVSLLLVNSEKGASVFNYIKEDNDIYQSNIQECLQPNLQQPTAINPQREQFWNVYYEQGFLAAMKMYGQDSWKIKAKKNFAVFLRKIHVLDIVKRIMRKTR